MKILISLQLCVLLLVCGCERSSPQLTVPPPEDLRILSLVTAADHILSELDAKDKIAGIDRHGRVLESMKNVPVTVAGGMVSREMLRQYKINYAIIWYYQRGLTEIFNKEGIPLMIVEPVSLASYPALVRDLGILCNNQVGAEKLLERWKKISSSAAGDAEKCVPIYFELYAPWHTPSADGYLSEILQKAGGFPAAAGQVSGTVSPEAVALQKPQVIFFAEGFSTAKELSLRPGLRNTQAVKNNRIYAVPRRLLCEGVAPDELLKFLSDKIKDF